MLPSLIIDLLKLLKEQSTVKAPIKNDYVVFGEFYNSIATSTLDMKYNKYIINAGVKRILLHEFRHSHASYLINRG